ncbi:MAG: hypothetical protein SFU83_08390 [Meiothermus sp.]|nr:hypothetical protein [Meiothermus sp.]
MHEFESVSKYRGDLTNPVQSDFVIDLDYPSANELRTTLEVVYSYVGQPLVYASGAKGVHIVVPWSSLGLPEGNWQPVFAEFAKEHKLPADPSIYKPRMMLRIAGSTHATTGRKKRLINPDDALDPDAVEVSYKVGDASKLRDWLLARQPESIKQTAKDSDTDTFNALRRLGTPSCISTLYLDGIPAQGQRNLTNHTLATYLRSVGKSLDEAEGVMEEFAQNHAGNTNASLKDRVRNAKDTVRTVYRLSHHFSCRRTAEELQICDTNCPLVKYI